MIKFSAIILAGGALFLGMGSLAPYALAQTPPPCTGGQTTGCTPATTGFSFSVPNPIGCTSDDDIPPILCVWEKIYKFIWNISFPIATIMILYAAWQILTAGGDPKKFESGKKTILYAVIGLAIVLVATALPLLIQDILTNENL